MKSVSGSGKVQTAGAENLPPSATRYNSPHPVIDMVMGFHENGGNMKIEHSRILVTGSSGMIGTCLCARLLERGASVTGFDRRPNRWSRRVAAATRIADLLLPESLNGGPGEFDMVIHLAANARVYELVEQPELARENILTVFNMLEFIRRKRIPRLIFASSREIYGRLRNPAQGESGPGPETCESNYAAGKLGGEALINACRACYGLDAVILRFSNVYGRYDFSDRVIPRFLVQALTGRDLEIYGEDKKLDFTYLDDTVQGVLRSVEQFENCGNQVFNIASGTGHTLVETAEEILRLTGSQSRMILKPGRCGEISRFVADIENAKQKLGYLPRTSFSEGLAAALGWYRSRSREYVRENPAFFQKRPGPGPQIRKRAGISSESL
jgi:UDP-glucose 4-epimerase